jgi:pimeloyl-ACP methyl ester carboxylesterase
MGIVETIRGLPVWASVLLAVTVSFVLLALVNYSIALFVERRRPPTGRFIEVNGVRLHYTDEGAGRAVVLLHGNGVSGDDYKTSSVAERLVGAYRVIIFDRPGFGHTPRPRGQLWRAAEQADLIHAAFVRLGVRDAIIVGHSWGTLVALALAQRHPANVTGLVLLSGYYFPTARLDTLLVAPLTMPVLGDILGYTIAPLFGWLTMPLAKRAMFAPSRVTERFKREFSTAMAVRPWQIRASALDGVAMVPDASRLSPQYGSLSIPVAIMTGDGDKVIPPKQADKLRGAIPDGTLQILHGIGHMIHHVATNQVVDAIDEVARKSAANVLPRAPAPLAGPMTRLKDGALTAGGQLR